jgi:alkanesulfonate monooxygenase SsuD/methylene tetrahydromethanopterin reductase-like flavin-dependent oxidoreductase (luciferase family)
VTFQGQFDHIDRACINPRPTRRIPIWFGGFSEPVFRRAARFGDGFIFTGPADRGTEGWKLQTEIAGAVTNAVRVKPFSDVASRVELAIERARGVAPRHILQKSNEPATAVRRMRSASTCLT